MPIQLAVEARGAYRIAFVQQLLAQAEGKIELAVHFGDKQSDFDMPGLVRMERVKGRRGHLLDLPYKGADIPLLTSPSFTASMEMCIDQLNRNSGTYQYRSHKLSQLQDYVDYYHILADALSTRLVESQATHLLFFDIPHLAVDSLLYEIARSIGIKVLIVTQFEPDRIYSLAQIEDLGVFDPREAAADPWPIDTEAERGLFYMNNNWQKPSKRGRLTARALLNLAVYAIRRDPTLLLKPSAVWEIINRMKAVRGMLPDWRDPFSRLFSMDELAYAEALAGFEKTEFDTDQPYVYVPLHLQPEMTTSSLGGIYRDQALLIEVLHNILPEGWRIYVKENPKQGSYARGRMFFERLARVPSVVFVPAAADTGVLTRNAKVVATVTGTAGWEAIQKGIPVVAFGAAWYRSLPGVHSYRPDIDLEQISKEGVDIDALSHAAGALFSRGHRGNVDKGFFAHSLGFKADENAAQVGQVLCDLLLGDAELSFGLLNGKCRTI